MTSGYQGDPAADPEPVRSRARKLPLNVAVLLLIIAGLVVVVIVQIMAGQSRATQNGRRAAVAIEAAQRNCDQVQQQQPGQACAVNPSQLPKPIAVRGERGFTGQQGDPGIQGLPGRDGSPGPQGVPGPSGSPGQQGSPGPQGPAGQPGQPGQNGQDGAPGQPGSNGADGAPGGLCPEGWTAEPVELSGALRLLCSRPLPAPTPEPSPSPAQMRGR